MGVSTETDHQSSRDPAASFELLAVLAHELRSPIGAILGFEELLREGILGELPPATADALNRIRGSARQLLDLVAGISDLAADPADAVCEINEDVDTVALLEAVLRDVQPELDGRAVHITRVSAVPPPPIPTDGERVRRALLLSLMAAIKASAGGTLSIQCEAGSPHEVLSHGNAAVQSGTGPGYSTGAAIRISGCRLEPERDDPDSPLHQQHQGQLSGAGLRVGMARRVLAPIGGRLQLLREDASATITIAVPSLTPR